MNRIDPSGAYSCGRSLGGAQCFAFKSAQAKARKTIVGTVQVLGSIKSKVESGEKLTADEQKASDRVSKLIGGNSGRDAKVLDSLIGIGKGIVARFDSSDPAEYGGKSATDDYARALSREVVLFDSNFGSTATQQAQTIAHEAAHQLGKGDLPPLRVGGGRTVEQLGPKRISEAARRYNNPGRMLDSPEAVSLALGLTRDDDFK